jgi:hypothetical protein
VFAALDVVVSGRVLGKELGSPEEAVAETKQMTILSQLTRTSKARFLAARLSRRCKRRKTPCGRKRPHATLYVIPLLGGVVKIRYF